MPRDMRASEIAKLSKLNRIRALARNELRGPSEPRVSAAGATSFPMKARDPKESAMIEAFLAAKNQR